MENGCPVLPKRINATERVSLTHELLERAQRVAAKLAITDEAAAKAFLRNFEHLQELGDPMTEWFLKSREQDQNNEDLQKNQGVPDSDDHYSF